MRRWSTGTAEPLGSLLAFHSGSRGVPELPLSPRNGSPPQSHGLAFKMICELPRRNFDRDIPPQPRIARLPHLADGRDDLLIGRTGQLHRELQVPTQQCGEHRQSRAARHRRPPTTKPDYLPRKLPGSGSNEPSGNRRLGKGRTGIPSRSCHFCQASFVNSPAGAFSSTLRNSSTGTYCLVTATSADEP